MQLGARGTSILFASGDGGVSGGQSQSCTTFLAAFPAGCPFLTAVGATQSVPETSAAFSSGGFSNTFSQPSFQSSAVSAYLTALGNTNSGVRTYLILLVLCPSWIDFCIRNSTQLDVLTPMSPLWETMLRLSVVDSWAKSVVLPARPQFSPVSSRSSTTN